jgi:hypothetical protein
MRADNGNVFGPGQERQLAWLLDNILAMFWT